MAENKKKKNKKQITLPRAVAAYAWIEKPDSGHKYSDNKHKVTMVYDDEASTEELVDRIRTECEKLALAEWGEDFDLSELQYPIRSPEDQTKDDFEGKYTITPKSKYAPMRFDAKRNKLAAKVKVFSGDVVASIIDLLPYESTEQVRENGKKITVKIYGVSAQLKAVQLIEKRGGGGVDASMFDEYDEGFDSSDFSADDQSDEGGEPEDDNADF